MKTSFTVLVSSLLALSLVGCAAVDNPAGSDTSKTASEAGPCVDTGTQTADNSESAATDEMAASEMSESTEAAAFRFHLLQDELPPAEGPEEEVVAFDLPADDGSESELSGDGSEAAPETTEASAEPEMAETAESTASEEAPCPPAGGESGESGSSEEGGEESQSELAPPEESMIGAEDDPTSEGESELVAPEEGEETAA